MIVCLDTNLVIWGIRGFYKPEDQQKAHKAQQLVKRLAKARIDIMFPACVLSETLAVYPEAEARQKIGEYAQKFQVGQVDVAVSYELSRLLHKLRTEHADTWGDIGHTKKHLKYDAIIVATAIAHGAVAIYSDDQGVAALSKDRIQVCRMDEMPDAFNMNAVPVDEEEQAEEQA